MCNVEDGNVIDPISREEVPEEYVISFTQNNALYCFDIRSLARYVFATKKYENPINRLRLPEGPPQNVVEQIDQYIEDQRIEVVLVLPDGSVSEYSSKLFDLGQIIIDAYMAADYRERIGYDDIQVEVGDHIVGRLSTMDLGESLVDLGTSLKELIDEEGVLTLRMIFQQPSELTVFRYNKIRNYADRNGKEWLVDQIDTILRILPDNMPSELDVQLIDDFGRQAEDRPESYIETGLKRLAEGAELNVSLIDRLIEAELITPDDSELSTLFQAAVDPYNYPSSSPYYRPLYQMAPSQRPSNMRILATPSPGMRVAAPGTPQERGELLVPDEEPEFSPGERARDRPFVLYGANMMDEDEDEDYYLDML